MLFNPTEKVAGWCECNGLPGNLPWGGLSAPRLTYSNAAGATETLPGISDLISKRKRRKPLS